LTSLSGAARRLGGVVVFLALALGRAWAGPAITNFYYFPITEDEAHLHYASLNLTPGYDDYVVNTISISPATTGTIIYYDQWENGFETDLANPANIWSSSNLGGTQIWGDNNPANGIPPGFATDVIVPGKAIILTSTNANPHPTGTFYYDGGDKMGTTKPLSVTMVLWPVFHDSTGDGVDLAEGISVYDTTRFGTEFYAPLGTNLTPNNMFESVRFAIMAAQDGTVVTVDRDGNGTTDATASLNEGEGWSDGPILAGGKVTATKPVQVHLLTGDIDAKYANRWCTLYPTNLWYNDHYTPVGLVNGAAPVYVYLFNKEASPITVTYLTSSTYGTVTVPAKGVYQYSVTADTGARFYTADGTKFQAVTTVDDDTGFDWSGSLVPGNLLSTVTSVGYGPGSEDGTRNDSPVWVVAVKATTIYVDYDGDPTTGPLGSPGNQYDVAYPVAALASTRVRDTDNNQTGMKLYTLDGTNIVAMWGEDPSTALGGRPCIDAGTSIIPINGVTVGDYIWNDLDADGVQDSNERGIAGVQVQVYELGLPFQPRTSLGTFADNFDQNTTNHLDGSNGTLAWTGPWGVTSLASVLLISGSDYEVRIDDSLTSALTRSFVVPSGTNQLTFNYDYRPSGTGDDTVKAQWSEDGTTWSDLATYTTGPGSTAGSATYTRTTTPGTRYLRFVKTVLGSSNVANEFMFFDNVSIKAETAAVSLISTTDVNGYYTFGPVSGLVPSTAYQLRVATNQAVLTGFGLTAKDQGGDDAKDSDADSTIADFATIPFTAPALLGANETLDFGFLQAGIGDFVWNDTNFNGQQDVGEAGLNGVTVNLYRPDYGPDGIPNNADDANVVQTTVTAAGGAYRFTNLPAGGYVVEFAPLANYVRTTADQGADATDSDANATTGRTGTVTLTAGQSNLTIDAGYYKPPPAIGDFVWFDENANGQQDDGEPGLNGVTVKLYDNLGALVATTTTAGIGAGAGFYSFVGIPVGTYQLEFGPLAGYHRSAANQGVDDAKDSDANQATGRTGNVTVTAGQIDNTVDAGYNALGIGDFVWKDLDADGVQDTGEPGIPGVVVRVYTSGGSPVPYQVRTPLGNFADNFDPAGGPAGSDGTLAWAADWTAANSAAVVENTSPDWEAFISDATTNSSLTRSFVVPANTDRLTITYDYRASGGGDDTVKAQYSANGSTWVDIAGATYNTTSSGSGSASVTVNTTPGTRYFRFAKTNGTGGSMYFDKVNIVAETALTDLTATTDAYGYYYFGAEAGLLPSTAYQLRVDLDPVPAALTGLALTGQDQGGNDATDSDATLATAPGFATIAFTSPAGGGSNQTLDFGFKGTATLGDMVWNDLNANGVQDGGETGIDGVAVTLYNAADNSVARTTTTASGGSYSFGSLVAGTYYVGFGAVSGYNRTLADQGVDTTDSDANAGTGLTGNYTLAAGATDITADAGYFQPVTLGDFVFGDANGNGIQDTGETGLAGVLVSVYRPGVGADGITGNADDELALATQTTPASGAYSFTGLRPGTYQVGFGPLSGYNRTLADQGTDDTKDSDATAGTGRTGNVVLAAGSTNTTVDAGYRPLQVLGDRVWLDEDGDGWQDAGEAGIANATVQLYASNGTTLLATTTTDSEGGYLFRNLAAGTYVVKVLSTSLPTGLAANPTYDLDGSGTPNTTVATVSTTGEGNFAVDFGYNWAPSSDVTGNLNTGAIGDRVWIDADGDGKQDPGEAGLGGVTVTLTTAGPDGLFGTGDDVTAGTTATAADGGYIFDGLAANAYRVTVNSGTTPSGYTQTGDPDNFGVPAVSPDNRTTAAIVLGPGDVYVNADFGYQPTGGTTGTVSGTVWFDADADAVGPAGTPGGGDTTEPTIAGVTVALIKDSNGNGTWDAGEPIIATTMTGVAGTFAFPGLPVTDGSGTDDYLVWVNDTGSVLTGLTQTYDANGTGTPNVSAASNLTTSGNDLQDFGYTAAGQAPSMGLIGDTVYLDRNGAGGQDLDGADNVLGTADDEPGLEGVTVQLWNSTETTLLATAATEENGRYAFVGLAAATYVVKVVTSTLPGAPGDTMTNTGDPDGGTASQSTVVLASGGINLAQDFGYRDTTSSNTIGGTVWTDTNTDGTLGGSEAGRYVGVTVVLRDSNGNVVGTAITDASGTYSFPGLPNGTYTVDVTDDLNVLNGLWKSNGANPGVDNNSQLDPYSVTVSGSATNTTADFGYYGAGSSVGNVVWNDRNGNSVKDAGEPGLDGVSVTLTITYPNGSAVTLKTTTAAAGAYSFANLLLDENFDGVGATYGSGGAEPAHVITVTTPTGFASTYDNGPDATGIGNGTDNNADNSAGEPGFPAKGGADDTNDFGFRGTGSIGDLVWVDLDNDGTPDANEPGVPRGHHDPDLVRPGRRGGRRRRLHLPDHGHQRQRQLPVQQPASRQLQRRSWRTAGRPGSHQRHRPALRYPHRRPD
jgi:hypothetical protein